MRHPDQAPDDPRERLPEGAGGPHPAPAPGRGMTQGSKGGVPGARRPDEHDESADSQAATPSTSPEIAAQAYEDVQRGLTDTSRGEASDEAYHRQVTPGTATPPPRRTY